MRAPITRLAPRLGAPLAIAAGAALLRILSGVGFANYDTLYALAWGGQLSRGATPSYGVPIAPTPHPLVEALGLVLSPLGPHAVEQITVALGFLALSACGWVLYRLGAAWFGRAAGALGALILLTRVPILSYGVRAYVDLPYLLLVLSALLVESRRRAIENRPAGAPVLALLALAGLLRPEAWAFSGLYWLYLMDWIPPFLRARPRTPEGPPPVGVGSAVGEWSRRTRSELAGLTLLALAAPLVWVLSDLAITGDPLWSLTNTRHTATTLHRVTGIANVPEYIPRRIGEILRPPVLVGAALGGILSLLWLRRRALAGAAAGVLSVVVFAAFAAAAHTVTERYVQQRLIPAALLLKAVGRAARDVPQMNGFCVDDEFRTVDGVHVGVATSLRGGGLIAPAIHDVDQKSLDQLMEDLRDVVERARTGTLRSSQMSDPTITITNLGDQGVETVFGVIYAPQVALVGFGRVIERPWAENGLLGVRRVVHATLSADHRVSDGHIGGRFLSAISNYLQEPASL